MTHESEADEADARLVAVHLLPLENKRVAGSRQRRTIFNSTSAASLNRRVRYVLIVFAAAPLTHRRGLGLRETRSPTLVPGEHDAAGGDQYNAAKRPIVRKRAKDEPPGKRRPHELHVGEGRQR